MLQKLKSQIQWKRAIYTQENLADRIQKSNGRGIDVSCNTQGTQRRVSQSEARGECHTFTVVRLCTGPVLKPDSRVSRLPSSCASNLRVEDLELRT